MPQSSTLTPAKALAERNRAHFPNESDAYRHARNALLAEEIEQLALAAGAAELYRLGAGKIADAFLESRLAGGWRHTYGVLDGRFDARYVLDLLYPAAV